MLSKLSEAEDVEAHDLLRNLQAILWRGVKGELQVLQDQQMENGDGGDFMTDFYLPKKLNQLCFHGT